ncbi:MAG: OB-fold nucleic acid binding domain-containing protein, partial [Proteobacteria bacterium]|nr:OB-fold nucleic acid binding domain-containing protein [Pseudomonadota bacterium]
MADEHTPQDENEIIALRRAHLAELRGKGNPFPNDFRRSHLAEDLHRAYGDADKEALEAQGVSVAVAGRIVLRRIMGKASFVTLADVSGRIQLYIRADQLGKEVYDDFKQWDIGDIVGARGSVMRTNKGELSVSVSELRLLTKSLRPLPEKHRGLTDTETRYRQRYLDLIANQDEIM